MKLHVNEEFSFKVKTIIKKGIFYTLLLSGFMYGSYKSGKDYCDEHPEYRYEDISNNDYNEEVDEEIEEEIEKEMQESIKEEVKVIEGINETINNNIIKNDERKVVAITFDDGPGSYTDRLLDILKENNVKVTFFVLGKNVLKYPDVVKRAYDEGHEICIHGYSHKYYTDKDPNTGEERGLGIKGTREEIVTTYNILREIDVEPQPYVRPPGGKVTDEIVQNIDYAFFKWSVDTRDWESRNKDKIKEIIYRDIENGSIVLQHDIHECSVDATEEYLPTLTSDYKFVTISELFNELDNDLEICNLYRNAKVKEKQLSY